MAPISAFQVREHPQVSASQPHVLAAFSRRAAVPSFITRAFTGGLWSHCGLVDMQAGVVIEALAWQGVSATPLADWMRRNSRSDFTRIACPRPGAALAFAYAQLGKPYDWGGALGVPWRNGWQRDDRWYCSELLECALQAGGRPRFRRSKRGVSPMESWNTL